MNLWRKIFAARVHELRTAKGISQGALGAVVDSSQDMISRIERGNRLTSMEVLIAFADFFDVSIDYLVGRSDDPARH